MQQRLMAIGLRPINALVDITNYVTFDRGRPLHVFDAAKVKGDLVVRRAVDGEKVLALDGREYTLSPEMCVIADGDGVESIAGIMGGEHSGCDESTTDVLIESALWNPLNVARTGRELGIITDARYRFERGVDPEFMGAGLELATRMVLELGGGEAIPASVHRIAQGGLRNVLIHVGLLKGTEQTRAALGKPPTLLTQALNREDYILAPESGIFEICVDLGEHVRQGQTVGYLHHLERPDRAPEEIVAQGEGYLITMRAPCLTRQGDCVAVIAKQVSEDEILNA
jgi:hypothetical protein